MKNYKWAKGYHYTKVPVYLISFWFIHWPIRFLKIGTKRKRTGFLISKDEMWKMYEEALTHES